MNAKHDGGRTPEALLTALEGVFHSRLTPEVRCYFCHVCGADTEETHRHTRFSKSFGMERKDGESARVNILSPAQTGLKHESVRGPGFHFASKLY